ncbi:MAG: CCA tRNA nucleotidyltransferase, partial [Candidatus Hydrogenedentes bacterium]|nr:CCA tRNA nucleotidyltransferase [Candidatus Hydrogenedentota bacterium]
KDYDIATSARAEEVLALFPKTVAVGIAFGVIVVLEPEGHFEVATFRRDGPYLDGRHPSHVEFTDAEQDARRRDFTVNALFLDPATGRILDFVGGQEDIQRRLIRAVGEPSARFQEDHLRLLRAVRFAARLGYEIEPGTMAAIRDLSHLITTTSAERIRDELVKLLTEGGARRGVALLNDTGLLGQILPEIVQMQGVEQPEAFHPEGDVYVHTLLLLQHLDLMDAPSPTLAMAALLHDVGKPITQTIEDRIRFNNHDKVGARMTEAICRRLRFSRCETERIVWLVEQHMRLAALPDMRESKRKRMAREDGFDELVQLGRLDSMASHGDTAWIDWIESYRAGLAPEDARPEPLVRGADLIEMGYAPGPLFAEIITAVEDAQLEGAIRTTEEARAMVRDRWPLRPA